MAPVTRTFVTFEAPPSSSTPPGAELTDHLRQRLAPGFEVSERSLRGDYGWEFDVLRGRDRFLVVLQRSDTWLVIVAPLKRFLGIFGGPSQDALLALVRTIHDALPSAGASSVGWFTRGEFEAQQPPSSSPDEAGRRGESLP